MLSRCRRDRASVYEHAVLGGINSLGQGLRSDDEGARMREKQMKES